MKKLLFVFACALILDAQSQSRVVDHRQIDLSAIPDEFIEAAKNDLHICFISESHGRNVTDGGMAAIRRYSTANNTKYAYAETASAGVLHLDEPGTYYPPESGWVDFARGYLDDHPECNVMIWVMSNSITEGESGKLGAVAYNHAVNYINTLEDFISEYGPGGSANRTNPVTFVFTTPPPLARYPRPLDHPSYPSSNDWSKTIDPWAYGTFRADSVIRKHCADHNRWLYDYYGISSTNPEGQHFGGRNTNGTYNDARRALDDCSYSLTDANHTRDNWALDWMAANPTHENTLMSADGICTSCEHSNGTAGNYIGTCDNARLQCVHKGKAAWYLWASLAGWGGYSVLPDKSGSQGCRMSCNPYSGNLLVTFDNYSGQPYSLSITDVQGRTLVAMDNLQSNSARYTLSETSKGLLVVTVTCGNEVYNQKIVLL